MCRGPAPPVFFVKTQHPREPLGSRGRPAQAAQLVLAIAEAQDYIGQAKIWCQVWVLTEQALSPRLQQDLRPAAVREITDYLELYQPYCPG